MDDSDVAGITPLYHASAEGHLDIVEFFLSEGVYVDVLTNSGCTPLAIASCYDMSNVIALLLKHNATIDLKDKDGVTPLMRALQYGNIETVRILVQNGADLRAKDNKNRDICYYLKKAKKATRSKIHKILNEGN